MSQVTKAIDINLPPQQVFDYIADARNCLSFTPNFTKFEPIGPIQRGLGAVAEAEGTFFGMSIKTALEIIEFEEGRRIVSRSTSGVKSMSIWDIKPLPEGGSEVTFTSEYSLPGKALGKLLDRLLIEKDVEKTVIQTLVNLKKVLEGKPNLRVVAS